MRAALALALVAFAACSRESADAPAAEQRPSAVPVEVATVEAKTVPIEVSAVGNAVAAETVAVRPQIDGQIARVHFREGEDVRRGELLFTLDARESRRDSDRPKRTSRVTWRSPRPRSSS